MTQAIALKKRFLEHLHDDKLLFEKFMGNLSSLYLVSIDNSVLVSEKLLEDLGYCDQEEFITKNGAFGKSPSEILNEIKISGNYSFKHSNGLVLVSKVINKIVSQKTDIQIYCLELVSDIAKREILWEESSNIARMGLWEVDLTTGSIFWDKMVREIHEVDADFVPNLETGINFYKEGASRDKITELVTKSIEKNEDYDVELKLVTAKGNEVWVRAIGRAIFEDGKCIKIFGVFQDVQEKYKWAIEIEERETRFQLAAEAANLGIWDLDPISGNLVWDDQMYSLYGVKKEDFEGVFEAWEASVHPDDKERSAKEINSAIAGKTKFDSQFRVIFPSGEVRHIRALAKATFDDKGVCNRLIGTNWDITEITNVSIAHENALLRLESVLNATTEVSIIGTDLVGNITTFNNGAEKLLGFNSDEIIGRESPALFHDALEVQKKSEELSEEYNRKITGFETFITRAREGAAETNEWTYVRKNKERVKVQLAVTSIKNTEDETIGYLGVAVDISNLKKAQSEIESLLSISGNQNQRLRNFAYIVSHNLRSYASNFSMLLSLAGSKDVDLDTDILPMLNTASNNLVETITYLNEVATINVDDKELEKFKVLPIIDKAIENSNGLIKQIGAKIEVDISDELEVSGVYAYLESIFNNLTTNSIKYRDPDRVLQIKISAKKEFSKIKLSIKDNGIGVDLKKAGDKIFGMYKTFHGNSDARGVGLFITKNQIEAMNGSIDIESIVGQGTEFKVVLGE